MSFSVTHVAECAIIPLLRLNNILSYVGGAEFSTPNMPLFWDIDNLKLIFKKQKTQEELSTCP